MRLSRKEFEDLMNYSCSLPTAFVPGKRWRRAKNYYDQDLTDPSKWLIGEDCYNESGDPVARWHEVHILTENEELIRKRLYGT